MKNILYSIGLIIISVVSIQAQKVRFYDVKTIQQYQQVLEQAMNEDKLLFLVIYEDGDDFYRMQKDDVFADPGLASAYEASIPLAVDIYSDMGARLAETFTIDKLPSFLYLTKDEALVTVRKGYLTIGELMAALREATQAGQDYAQLQKKYADNTLAPAEWVKLIRIHSLNFSFNETRLLATGFLNGLTNAQLLSQEIVPITATYGVDLETKYPKLIIDNREKLSDKIDYQTFYESAYSFNFDRAVASEDTVMLEKIVTVLLPNSPDKEADVNDLIFETRKVFASETQLFNIWKKAALERAKSIESDSTRAEFLFEEAFEIAENFNSPESQKAARELAATANATDPHFRYKMLEAYMAYLLKDYTAADALVKEAAPMSQSTSDERKAANLQEMITKEMNTPQEEE